MDGARKEKDEKRVKTKRLMNTGFLAGGATGEEIKVAALIGLGDVLGVHALVTTFGWFGERWCSGAAFLNFFIAHMPVDGSLGNIDLDLIARLDECEGATPPRFRGRCVRRRSRSLSRSFSHHSVGPCLERRLAVASAGLATCPTRGTLGAERSGRFAGSKRSLPSH